VKYFAVLLAGGLTLLVVLAVGIFSFLPQEEPPQPAVVVPVAPATSQLEASLAEREATYQAQIAKLNQTLQERRATYQTHMQDTNAQIATAQQQLNALKAQEQNLLGQAAQLETTRAERLAAYQTQLEQAQGQYSVRYTELQAQLNEARTNLANAQAQLGQ
jgi:chromosome segregation ATPase